MGFLGFDIDFMFVETKVENDCSCYIVNLKYFLVIDEVFFD